MVEFFSLFFIEPLFLKIAAKKMERENQFKVMTFSLNSVIDLTLQISDQPLGKMKTFSEIGCEIIFLIVPIPQPLF